ncbi:MAG TPA: FAD-dependent monooxygenase [Candidatus Angelobacter sp.]|jgi:flavin-dependent dehydrogenase
MNEVQHYRCNFDAIVVGAGPAGALCATLLSRSGARVALIHQAKRTAHIEVVSGKARRLVETHNPHVFRRCGGATEIHETISIWENAVPAASEAILNPWGSAIVLDRFCLDQILREAAVEANVLLFSVAQPVTIAAQKTRWHLSLATKAAAQIVKAPFVVFATGRGARVPGRMEIFKSDEVAVVASLPARSVNDRHRLYIEAVSTGWWYAIPEIANRFSVGFCTTRDQIKQRGTKLPKYFISRLRETTMIFSLLARPLQCEHAIAGRLA